MKHSHSQNTSIFLITWLKKYCVSEKGRANDGGEQYYYFSTGLISEQKAGALEFMNISLWKIPFFSPWAFLWGYDP